MEVELRQPSGDSHYARICTGCADALSSSAAARHRCLCCRRSLRASGPSSPGSALRAGKRVFIRLKFTPAKRRHASRGAGRDGAASTGDSSVDTGDVERGDLAGGAAGGRGEEGSCGVSIAQLPEDVLLHILSFLDKRELIISVSLVCHAWRELAAEPCLWRELQLTKYGERVTDGLLQRVADHCPELTVLDLSRCPGFGLAGLQALAAVGPTLRRLDLTGCGGVKMECLAGLAHLPCLEELAVSNTEILRRATDRTIPRLPRLSSLNISGIALDGALLGAVAAAWGRSLTRLVAREIYNLTPDTVFAFCATPRLVELEFQISRGACWTTAAPLGRLTALERLSIPDALDDEAREACADLAWLAPLARLQELRVGACRPSPEGLAALASLPALSRLRLTLASAPGPPLAAALHRLPRLTALHLRDSAGSPFPGPSGTRCRRSPRCAPSRPASPPSTTPPPPPRPAPRPRPGPGPLERDPQAPQRRLLPPGAPRPVVARLSSFHLRLNDSCLVVGDRSCLYEKHVSVHLLTFAGAPAPGPAPPRSPPRPRAPPPVPSLRRRPRTAWRT
eukprot:tig00001095_g7037.t1